LESIRYVIAAGVGLLLIRIIYTRLRLSLAKHPSLRGHSKMSRRMAKLVSYFEYGPERWFTSDLAPGDISARRRAGIERLRQQLGARSPLTQAFSQSLETGISDVQFTSQHRVPFPYRALLPREFKFGSAVSETRGVQLRDLDGHWRYDVSGSYGVNVFGFDFYKDCINEGHAQVSNVGLVLGPYHPTIRENVEALREISGLDEVSFHMSGTEAVMQAVRLARYHTGKTHLVRLCGAYHGWWDGVQPGVGNTRAVNDVYTLADLSPNTLKVLDTRKDIACVLINPIQAMHPNGDAPGDASLVASDRKTAFNRERYAEWLKQIREVCTLRGIVLIVDDVFMGFRLAYRGSQEYFGIQADMVTYGKTLGGGMPVGVLCGRADLMKRFRDDQPANLSFARGTFNSHPLVMACMAAFLRRIRTPEIQAVYRDADALWNTRIADLNQRLEAAKLPVRLANMHSILTILYTEPCRYNWMFQFYLRAEGLELSWIGSGRLIMSLNFSDEDFAEVSARLERAAQTMKNDGWWWAAPHLTNQWIKRQMAKDMLAYRFGVRIGSTPQAGPSPALASTPVEEAH